MSPRPKKPRTCACLVRGGAFKPAGIPMGELTALTLGRDELEALRLCDGDGLTQEEAGRQMGVSRGTVQRLLSAARRKLAIALTEPHAIVFDQD